MLLRQLVIFFASEEGTDVDHEVNVLRTVLCTFPFGLSLVMDVLITCNYISAFLPRLLTRFLDIHLKSLIFLTFGFITIKHVQLTGINKIVFFSKWSCLRPPFFNARTLNKKL